MKYKLFPIEWRGHYPLVKDSMLTVTEPTIGSRIQDEGEQYRIFGYADDGAWVEKNKICMESYHPPHPARYEGCCSDHAGNRKYAIGRLEE